MIRYFHYVSAQKVDEAFNQISRSLFERLSVELNSAFLPLAIKADSEPRAGTLEAKVEVVEAALRAEGQVGTIAAPGPWFGGTMTMNWGCFGSDAEGNPDVIFFIGTYGDILVALGGSAHHARRSGLTENPRPYSNSGWETMMKALHQESRRVNGGEELRPATAPHAASHRRTSPRPASAGAAEGHGDSSSVDVALWQPTLPGNAGAWPSEAREVLSSFRGPGREVEFVARWSDQSDYINDHPAILGSPLYVADAPGAKALEPSRGLKRWLALRAKR